jgi:hypothetical protein
MSTVDFTLAARKLTDLGKYVTTFSAWQPKDGKTYCNFAANHAAKAYGYTELEFAGKPLLANRQIEVIRHSLDWRKISGWENCQQLQNAGKLIFYCKKAPEHGHLCFGVPSVKGGAPMAQSSAWRCAVPFAANVGRTNSIRGLNWAFRADDQPEAYLYDPKPKTHIVMEPLTITGELKS